MQVKRIMTPNSRLHLLWKTATSLTITLLLSTQVIAVPRYETDTSPNEVNPINVTYTIKETFGCEEYKLRICVLEIANGEIDSALNTYKILQDNHKYDTLRTIIKQTYAKNDENMPKLLNFVIQLPECNQKSAGFEFLFQALRWNTQGSFQFAYQLKKFEEGQNCSRADDCANLREKLIYLKHRIPVGIKTIIWQESNLCLKNTYNKEYLYMPACCNYDNERRRLFSWIPKGEIGPQGAFTFEPIRNAALFRIKNEYFQEHLYAADCCFYDKERRNVFTWIPKGDIGTQGEWTLELVNESNLFRIRNNHYGEYLYAAECCYYDKERRSIFTWIPKGDIGIQGEWEIESC